MRTLLPAFLPLLVAWSGLSTVAIAKEEFLTFDNTPLGTLEKPLILRTYMPDPGLGEEVFAHHGTGASSPKYNPGSGKDVKGEYTPVKGIPAAIAVNYGPALSYCFDTTECRLMYAWQGGFLDMYPYWGDPVRGNRQSFNYVPHLVGNVFYMAKGRHPVFLDGKSLSDHKTAPRFLGYTLVGNRPEFRFQVGDTELTWTIEPATAAFSMAVTLSAKPAPKGLAFRLPDGVMAAGPNPGEALLLTVKGKPLANFQGYPRDTRITRASAEAGERLYQTYGCLACHSADGSKGHGPTFLGLHGSARKIAGANDPVTADDAYILESMKAPNARTVEGFPPNYMPPYQLKDLEYESLLLFIKSLNNEPQ